jgi:hypothetical protein
MGGAGSGTDTAPSTFTAFIEILLPFRSAFPPFHLSAHGHNRACATMHSLILVLIALPLASLALAINFFDDEAELFAGENGTTSNEYWLQQTYEGDTFFE